MAMPWPWRPLFYKPQHALLLLQHSEHRPDLQTLAMAAFPSHSDLDVSTPAPDSAVPGIDSPPAELLRRSKDPWTKRATKKKKNKNLVFMEDGAPEVTRTKSLTDEDLDELKGCVDLGFGFRYDEIPELCSTLPALELCYSMSQRFLDEQQKSPEAAGEPPSEPGSSSPSPVANWRISGPGDHPDDVKARLKYWAQAVACTVRLCS